MNYYEHHLGDYVRDTAHLSLLEDGAYRRLIDAYYVREAPLPKPLKDVCRLVRANSKPERDAVATVLREFFQETEEGWRHKRCDAEIARFLELEPERASKRENERERQRRTRERRRELFDILRSHGIVPAYDSSMAELQAAINRVTSPQGHAPVTRDVTAAQTPTPRHQTDTTLISSRARISQPCADTPARAPETRTDVPRGTPAPKLDELLPPAADRTAVAEWQAHRAAREKPLREHELIAFGKTLAALGEPAQQLATVRHVIANGWLNLRQGDRITPVPDATAPRWEPPDDETPEEPFRAQA